MGSVYAARLAIAGNDVLAVDRWVEHVDSITRNGLRIVGPGLDASVHLRAVTAAPDEPFDLIILSVKAADVGSAAHQATRMLTPRTVVLTIQNGLGAAETVAEIVGEERVAVGIASGFGAELTGPGSALHYAMRAVRFGAYRSLSRDRLEEVAEVWRDAGFDAQAVVADIEVMQWEKLICNVAYSAACALTGFTVGEVMTDPDIGPVSREAAIEAWGIARAAGIALTVTDPVAYVTEFGSRQPKAKPSALQDHEAGRISEIDSINGAVVRQAARIGREAPVNRMLAALVRLKERSWELPTAERKLVADERDSVALSAKSTGGNIDDLDPDALLGGCHR
jgi:2-dehydropantoate 2-reductase